MSLQVTIGTAPCSWGVWWPDGTPSGTPYNVFLDQAAEAGYKALELGPVGYLPTDIGQLRDELARRAPRHPRVGRQDFLRHCHSHGIHPFLIKAAAG